MKKNRQFQGSKKKGRKQDWLDREIIRADHRLTRRLMFTKRNFLIIINFIICCNFIFVGILLGILFGLLFGDYISSFFDIKYKHDFSSCIKLWERGLVPSFDGKIWRLHGYPNGKILWEGKL